MTIEITLRSGKKAVLNRERMTFTTGDTVKPVFPLPYWPIVEQDGAEVCVNPSVVSWKEIPDVKPLVSKLSVVPCPGVPVLIEPDTNNKSNGDVQVPSPPQVPDTGTDWIK